MTATQPRPRIVNAAFWCWLFSSILLTAFGLLLALTRADVPMFLRGAGVLLVATGLALGYLAGRTRKGSAAFRRAAVALATVLVVLLALLSLSLPRLVGPIAFIMIVTMVGAVLMMRPSAQEWFDEEEPQ